MNVGKYSKFKVVKFLGTKGEALEKFQDMIAGHGIPKVLTPDNGKEFTSRQFEWYCIKIKIKQGLTLPENFEKKGLPEGANRTLIEMARCLLLQARLPRTSWLRVFAIACYLRNLVSNNKK